MAYMAKVATGTEAANDSLNAVVSKALGLPRAGTHVGRGPHVNMPPTWDGQGATPPGWTKQQQAVWVVTAANTALPIPDTLATLLQAAAAQDRLTGPEQAQLATAIAGRVTVDLEAGYLPKANAARAAENNP